MHANNDHLCHDMHVLPCQSWPNLSIPTFRTYNDWLRQSQALTNTSHFFFLVLYQNLTRKIQWFTIIFFKSHSPNIFSFLFILVSLSIYLSLSLSIFFSFNSLSLLVSSSLSFKHSFFPIMHHDTCIWWQSKLSCWWRLWESVMSSFHFPSSSCLLMADYNEIVFTYISRSYLKQKNLLSFFVYEL